SGYNRLDVDHCAENRRLLTDILRDEWGFDGFVVSDWFGAHEPVGAANAGLTLEMPAPVQVYGRRLVEAVEAGHVSESTVDGLVHDLLTVMNRTKADERNCDEPEESVDDPTERALTRRAAIAGTVLLRNEPGPSLDRPALPLRLDATSTIAVIGPNAIIDRSMGGGSASLTPFAHRTLLDALTERLATLAPAATVSYEPGVRIDRLTPIVQRSQLRTPGGEPGLRLEYVNGSDWDAPTTLDAISATSIIRFFGTTPEAIDASSFGARVTGSFIPAVDGPHEFGVVSTGPVTMTATAANGSVVTVVDDPEMQLPRTREFFGYGSEESKAVVDCNAGRPVDIAIKWRTAAANGFAARRVGVRAPAPADLVARAVDAARSADVAVVVVGTNDEWETEGFDREFMELPGRQDELVEQVVSANPNTVVVVNAGSPVTMDWAAESHPAPAAAIVTSFFAGQEQAEAMVDVLLGDADPAGRLPVTYPKRLSDTPAHGHYEPVQSLDGPPRQRYAEGLSIGHRHYEANGVEPRFWFGHGLSYGSADWGTATADCSEASVSSLVDEPFEVTVPITATGTRPATVVVQAYVAPIDPPVERPPRELKAWVKLTVEPGGTAQATLRFGPDAFHHWDVDAGDWTVAPGRYDIVIAMSSSPDAEHARLAICLT
ncbi:MAG: glycoside hydrolase family 3 C-terminal domain-containing protein, partial [Ilumatobacter sp.]